MFAVLFEVEPIPERRDAYLKLAAFLKPELEKIDGFINVERFASARTEGRVLSLSLWRDEKAVIRWRTLGAHHEVQAKGRSGIFRDYHLRVGEVTADTGLPDGETLARHRFDQTEVGAAKVVTISEVRRAAAGVTELGLPAAGLVDAEAFESIYSPGKTLVLGSWRDAEAAGLWQPGIADARHRQVRIIRDYGMFDRREAPHVLSFGGGWGRFGGPIERAMTKATGSRFIESTAGRMAAELGRRGIAPDQHVTVVIEPDDRIAEACRFSRPQVIEAFAFYGERPLSLSMSS